MRSGARLGPPAALGWLATGFLAAAAAPAASTPAPLPVPFEDHGVGSSGGQEYLARAGSYTASFLPGGVRIHARDHARGCEPEGLRLRLGAGAAAVVPEGDIELPGRVNYFLGKDPACWRAGIRTFARVVYPEVAPGVAIAFGGAGGELEAELAVAAGADLEGFRLTAETGAFAIDSQGDAVLAHGSGELRLRAPVAYQQGGRGLEVLAARFVALDRATIGLQVPARDRARPLVIDPVLGYASFLGGTGRDGGTAMVVDAAGNILVAGYSNSPDFPQTPPVVPPWGGYDVALTRLDPSGSTLIYSTLIGGTGVDYASWLALDGTGRVWMAGNTASLDFPVLLAPQPSFAGGATDSFVAAFDAMSGSLVLSSYLGGSGDEAGYSHARVAVDASGQVWIAGTTDSPDFPTLAPLQPALAGLEDLYLTRLDPALSTWTWSTYLGGMSSDALVGLALDPASRVYLTGWTNSADFPLVRPIQSTIASIAPGQDAFLCRIDPTSSLLEFSTYHGGRGDDNARGVIAMAAGVAVISGYTRSDDFPVVAPVQAALAGASDVFVSQIDTTASTLQSSTFVGGFKDDYGLALSMDSLGDIFVSGETYSSDLPLVLPLQGPSATVSNLADAFVVAFNPTLSGIYYSTYLQGAATERVNASAIGPGDALYGTGATASTDFPVVAPVQSTLAGREDTAIWKLSCSPPSDAGNRLFVVRTGAGTSLGLRATEAPETSFFRIYEDTVKDGAFAALTGIAPDGRTGLDVPMPVAPLVFYRIASVNPCGEGPR